MRVKRYKEIANVLFLSAFFVSFISVKSFSQQEGTVRDSEKYCGFRKVSFQFEGKSAGVVFPDTPCQSNSWLWKVNASDSHHVVDSILLSKGFHVVYFDPGKIYDCAEILRIFDRFYLYMLLNWGLSDKVALESINEGAIYAYIWATNNPTRVACLYAVSPVCNNKIFGDHYKSSELCLGTEKPSVSFDSNSNVPKIASSTNYFFDLKRLAACKVPVLHTISLSDSVVPPEENTFKLINDYFRLGGTAGVIPVNHNLTGRGHYSDIGNLRMIADFIERNFIYTHSSVQSEHYFNIRDYLKNSKSLFETTKKGNVVFVGGSITAMQGWRDKLSDYLKMIYFDVDLNILNAAIPSLGSLPHAFRFNEDVLRKMIPDLLFLEAAVNDHANGYTAEEQVRSMEGIVRQAKTINPKIDIVILYFADPDKNTSYAQGNIPEVIKNHEKVASHYSISSVNLAHEISDRILGEELSWEYDFVDLHPSPFGHELYFASIKSFFESVWADYPDSSSGKTDYTTLLDQYSYMNGNYSPIEKADLKRGFTYDPSFYPDDGLKVRPGFFNVPALVADSSGAELEYRFKGSAIGINILSGGDAGIIEYSVDKRPFVKVDLFTKWSKNIHLPWYIMLEDELPNKKHLLRIRLVDDHNSESKGTACRIVRFLVNDMDFNRER